MRMRRWLQCGRATSQGECDDCRADVKIYRTVRISHFARTFSSLRQKRERINKTQGHTEMHARLTFISFD